MPNWYLENEQQTLAFATAVAQLLPTSLVIYLHGELGAGKTCFSRGLINSFGHKENVKSPTYTLVETYALDTRIVYHFDLYRLSDPEELEYMGIRDYLSKEAIVLIEWPERGKGWLPEADLEVTLNYKETGREIQWEAKSKKGRDIIHTNDLLVIFSDFPTI